MRFLIHSSITVKPALKGMSKNKLLSTKGKSHPVMYSAYNFNLSIKDNCL